MKIMYVCEGCGEQYTDKKDAERCEAKVQTSRVAEVGDIVKAHAGFGWYDGNAHWVANPKVVLGGHKDHGNCFGRCCSYEFYYVVTTIDVENHRVRYHLETKAMTGKEGHRGGYTFNEDHFTPRKVKRPPERVVKDSYDLIGNTVGYLL